MSTSVKFKINDCQYTADLSSLSPDISLNTYIREHAQLTATKFMCLEGGCGACVVAIKGKHPITGIIRTWAANSCLTLLNSCMDWEIMTCEGIGNKLQGYHPIQRRMAQLNASQCGFCTPGFVMNMYSLMESKNNHLTMEEIENSFGGNICRCTGYRPILDAMKSFAIDKTLNVKDVCTDIEELSLKTCPKSGKMCSGGCKSQRNLKELIYDNGSVWYWPKTLNDIFEILNKINPKREYTLVAGNTAHGVYRRSESIKCFIDINDIPELKNYNVSNEKLTLGANLSLTETMNIFSEVCRRSGFEYCNELCRHFDLIANVPVRNTGTLAGNISIKKMHREFPSDVFITFEALNVQLIVATTPCNQGKISLAEYLELTAPNTIIIAFELPAIPKDKSIFRSYKIMPRSQNAHALVNAAFLLQIEPRTGVVSDARICFGGIRPDFVHASAIEQILRYNCFYNKDVVASIFSELEKFLQPNDILPLASPEYRRMLASGLMLKFLLENAPADAVKQEFKSGGQVLKRNLSSGIQVFDTQEGNYPVTQPVQKIEALIQCSGEATYTNDLLSCKNSVYCAFVNATVVGATIEQIIASEALSMPGVITFYTATDIPGTNTYTAAELGLEIEEIFSSGLARFYDQPLGMIVAESSDIANKAAAKIKVLYSIGDEMLIMPTLQDALESKHADRIHNVEISKLKNISTYDSHVRGDIKGKGTFELGPQYHFQMEPHTCVAVPFEQGLQVWATTQWMDNTQATIANMLQLNVADVQVKVRRLGGAYGSKITGSNRVACAASLAAFKLNRPARFVQTIESMMSSVGKRWACRSDYEFHVQANGKIVSLRNTYYEDAGCTLNENPIMLYVNASARSCYAFTAGNLKLDGSAVITDAPSSIYCRAPGSLEGTAMIENIMEHIAFETDVDPADVRLRNLQPGNKMNELLPDFLISREYKSRRQEIDEFNLKNRWIKRGIGLSIMQYTNIYFNVFPATVSIYSSDGSVIISHGGIEMGQGLNTKAAQVAALHLGVPMEKIKFDTSNTVNGANAFITGGSVASESVCYAVRECCKVLNERLKPIRQSLPPNSTWLQIVTAARTRSINLIASEAFELGNMNNYNVYGLDLTEMEVDILTGNHIIRRVDILQDCGESLSPFVDVGQVEGGFVMCLGYWLTEQLVYDRQTGQLLNNRSWNYKPPGAKDIPVDFRIELLRGSPNSQGFMRSKTAGEPSCCLSVSAIFALQHALQSARKDAGQPKEWIRLGAPTTAETIVLNAGHNIRSFTLT